MSSLPSVTSAYFRGIAIAFPIILAGASLSLLGVNKEFLTIATCIIAVAFAHYRFRKSLRTSGVSVVSPSAKPSVHAILGASNYPTGFGYIDWPLPKRGLVAGSQIGQALGADQFMAASDTTFVLTFEANRGGLAATRPQWRVANAWRP
jgi:hypothetical protein